MGRRAAIKRDDTSLDLERVTNTVNNFLEWDKRRTHINRTTKDGEVSIAGEEIPHACWTVPWSGSGLRPEQDVKRFRGRQEAAFLFDALKEEITY